MVGFDGTAGIVYHTSTGQIERALAGADTALLTVLYTACRNVHRLIRADCTGLVVQQATAVERKGIDGLDTTLSIVGGFLGQLNALCTDLARLVIQAIGRGIECTTQC